MKKKKTIIISLILLIIFLIILILLIPATPISLTYRYNSKEMIERISKVNSKSELEDIFEEVNAVSNELNNLSLVLKTDITRVFHGKPILKGNLRVIIDFLSDKKLCSKYRIGDMIVSSCFISIIESPDYILEQKEFAIDSLDSVPVLKDIKNSKKIDDKLRKRTIEKLKTIEEKNNNI